jgi:RNA polymerase sigma-B factor
VVHAARSSRSVGDVLPGDERAVSRVEDWFRRYADTRDPAVRERIIVAYLGLADRLADRYRSSLGVTPEDLRQTARMGLVAAVDRYDPGYGNPFVPYAVACVVGEIKRYLRDTSLAGPRLPAGQGALPAGPQGPGRSCRTHWGARPS